MSAGNREFAMQEGFVTDAGSALAQVVGSDTPVPYVQLGGGTLNDGDKVMCFAIPSGKRSMLGVLKVN